MNIRNSLFIVISLLFAAGACLVFMASCYGLEIDDAYIFIQYARNLKKYFMFIMLQTLGIQMYFSDSKTQKQGRTVALDG